MVQPLLGAALRAGRVLKCGQPTIYRRVVLHANDADSQRVIRSARLVMPYYCYRGQVVIPSAVSACLTDGDPLETAFAPHTKSILNAISNLGKEGA